jgi:aminopeptidase YwaD
MIKKNIHRKQAGEAIALTGKIIDECSPRLCGSAACKNSAVIIKKELDKYCDSAGIDEFDVHPNAFLGFMKVSAVTYIVSTVLLFLGYPLPAALGYTSSVVLTVSQFVFYLTLFDRLYKKAMGYNVYGVIEPAGEVKQQIIVSGHHDSAFEFTFFKHFPKLYQLRIVLGFLPIDVACALSWTWVVMSHIYGAPPVFADALRYGALLATVLVVPLYFFTAPRGTPGAGDNLVASVIAVKIAEIFSKKKNRGRPALRNTRVILASFDAEEVGLRGARAFAKEHRERLVSVPTYHFNMDCIFDVNKIKFMTADINGFVRLSKGMAKECAAIAGDFGYRAKLFRMFFGAGATDAAELAKIGAEATTLMAMSTKIEKSAFFYHTALDTIDRVQPEAVEACLKIISEYITRKDAAGR